MNLLATALLLIPVGLSGQSSDSSFTAYLLQSAKPLAIRNGRLQGAGASWLQSEADSAQFVFLGEDHGLAETELVTSAVWRTLVPLGYRHLALEEGPWIVSLMDRYVRGRGTEALAAYRAAIVPGLPPASAEHLDLVETLRQTTPHERGPVVWGLDQEQRAAPLLSRLVALAPTPTSRVVAEATLAEAQRREATGHYLLDGYADQIGALQRAFSGRTSQETAWLLALLAQSNRIYDNNNAPAAEQRGYAANQEREDMMKGWFLASYRSAQHSGETRPRVLLRLGDWHGMRGYSPTQVSSLGNFVAELARVEGGRLFNIAMTCGGGERSGIGEAAGQVQPCGAEQAAWFQPILPALSPPMTIFDLRPLRAAHHAGLVRVPAELVQYVYSYDALLIVSRSSALHFPSAPAHSQP